MEEIWACIFFDELKVSPEEHNIFHIESTFSNLKSRKELAEIMFEKFNIFNIHIEAQGALALWATAKPTALIIESDHSDTQIIPVFDKYLISKGFKYINFSGVHMTNYFQEELIKKLPKYCYLSNPKEVARKLKESVAEFKTKESSNEERRFELSDGNVISIREERFNISDLFYNPQNIGLEIQPLHEAIYESILNCDIHIRKELLGNILLSGGNSMINGFPEVLKENLIEKFGEGYRDVIKVNAQSDRKYSVWNGASVICSYVYFQNMWVSKNDYDEFGENIFSKNFFI